MPRIFQSLVVGSAWKQWFGWTVGRQFGSFCRAGTESAEGRGSGCVAGDACRRKAGAAFSQAAFDVCSKVVGACGPLAG